MKSFLGFLSVAALAAGCGDVKIKTEVNGFNAKDSKNAVFGFFELNGLGSFSNEDLDGDGVLDGSEDVNNNGILDPGEDLNVNGFLDGSEDTNGNGVLDREQNDLNSDGVIDDQDVVSGAALFVLTSETETLCDDLSNPEFIPSNDSNVSTLAFQFKTGAVKTDIASGVSLTNVEGNGIFDFTTVNGAFSVFEDSVQTLDASSFADEQLDDSLFEIEDLSDTLTINYTGTLIFDSVTNAAINSPLEAKFNGIERCANADNVASLLVGLIAGFGGLEEI